jgi:hypothetical protein
MNRIRNICLLALLGACAPLAADTFVPPTINTVTWTKSANNYIIAADATVPSGQVLTIEPGVVVILAPGVELNVQGRLLAVGSRSEHITFRGVSAENYWTRIFVQDTGKGISRFQWCDFSDATNALYLYIYGRNATMTTEIFDCTFTHFTDTAIYARARGYAYIDIGGGHSYSPTIIPEIKNCLIENDSRPSTGITVNIYGQNGTSSSPGASAYARPLLLNNVIRDVAGPAFEFVNGPVSGGASNPVVINNTVSGVNQGIVTANPFDIVAKNNIFINCTNAITRLNSSTLNLTIQYNCFFGNTANFVNYPAGFGNILWTNANGDPADINFNFFESPELVDPPSLVQGELKPTSPCIDAGDPAVEYNDLIFPPSQGAPRNDVGATGGPYARGQLEPIVLSVTGAGVFCFGNTVTLTVKACGQEPLTFQWKKDGVSILADPPRISGVNSDTLIIKNVGAGDIGDYTVFISNAFGDATSAAAVIELSPICLDIDMFAGVIIKAEPGKTVKVEYTNDLTSGSWTTLVKFVLPESPYTYIDYDSPNHPKRFYRASEATP